MKLKLKENNYVCLFPLLANYHAIKCTGQVCENVAKQYNKNAYIISYKNGEDYSNFKTFCPNVNLIFLKGKSYEYGWKRRFQFLSLIIRNAKKIDTFYFYYSPANTIFLNIIGILYKLINPRGKLHIRFEYDLFELHEFYPLNPKNGKVMSLKDLIRKKFFEKIDILGVLDDEKFSLSKTKKFWSIIENKSKIKQQLNGFIDIDKNTFNKKQSIISLAGRLNAKQKGFDIFLDAIKKLDLKNWEIYLLGTINEQQREQIKLITEKNKTLKDKIHEKGHISDVKEYWQYLNISKVFCLPSIHDGIPLVIPDAMARGNVIVSSDLFGIKNIISRDSDIAYTFKNGNSSDLADKLQFIINNPDNIEKRAQATISRAEEILSWNSIVKNLEL